MTVHGGAAADVSELEYISSLHQTGPNVRKNGTVSATDVQRLLMSRYGIKISHKLAIEIIRGLGGGSFQPPISAYFANNRIFRRNRKNATTTTTTNKKDVQETSEHSSKNASLLSKDGEMSEHLRKEEEDYVSEEKGKGAKHAGMKDEEVEEYMDLVQILAVLLIPAFARFRNMDTDPKNVVVESNPSSSLDPQPPSLMKDALRVLLKNISVDDGEMFPLVDMDLIEALLLDVGEMERSQDQELLREMVAVATTASRRLDVEAFVQACTSDTTAWIAGSEDCFTTFEEDVELMCSSDKKEDGKKLEVSKEPMKKSIDYVIDSHTSVLTLLLVWAFFFFTSITYGALFQSTVVSKCERNGDENFGCILGSTIWTWVVFAFTLSICGLIVVWPLSWGNDPSNRTLVSMVTPVTLTLAYSFIPYFITDSFIQEATEPYNPPEERAARPFFEPLLKVQFTTGMLLVGAYLLQALALCIPNKFRNRDSLQYWFSASQSVGEVRSKKAGARKINKLILNAHNLHNFDDLDHHEVSSIKTVGARSSIDQVSLQYILKGKTVDDSGGMLWSWRQFLTGRLFDTEGIWLPSRLIVIQGVLLGISIVLGLILLGVTEYAADEADKAQESLDQDLPTWVVQLIPSREDVYTALFPASATSIIAMIFLNIIYIPSSVNTIMQYRCGLIPSLDSQLFKKLRIAVDSAYTNTGNAIYGLIGSALLFYVIVGLVIFLFIYEVTKEFMIRILAWGLGLSITILFKMILVRVCRRTMYRSFYRIRPQSANISSLLLECWFLGLGSSVLIGRITQFLLAAVLWVGRIDVPYLSPNVNVVGYSFDFVPANFVKDLLVHEAHHHPYVERLAQMYLLTTKNRKFGSNAGAAWRQLFVLSFMPWMRKYRVFWQERISQAKDDLAFRKLEAEEDEIGFGEQMHKDLFDLKDNILSSAEEANAVREKAQKDAVDLTHNLFHSVEKQSSDDTPKGADAGSIHMVGEF